MKINVYNLIIKGGKQVPDGFHLVMSPSWLSKVQSADDPALSSLMMHKSISFHENGASYIDEYDPPRKVTYFVNYFTDTITSGHRSDGVDIEV
jgi:carnosine synthase